MLFRSLFVCKNVYLKVENTSTRFTAKSKKGDVLEIPIAHGDGNYFTDEKTLKRLEDNDQIVFRYCERNGDVTEASNPNGSMNNIAGIINKKGNVLGIMPHPERASDEQLNLTDGKVIFDSIINSVLKH